MPEILSRSARVIGAGMPVTASPFSTSARRSFAVCAFAAVSAANGSRSAIFICAIASSFLCPSMSSACISASVSQNRASAWARSSCTAC